VNLDIIKAIQGGQAGHLAVTLLAAEAGAAMEFLRGVDGEQAIPHEHQERMVQEWAKWREMVLGFASARAAEMLPDWKPEEHDQLIKAIAACVMAQVNLHATAKACGLSVKDAALSVSTMTGTMVEALKLDQRKGGAA